MNRGFKTYLGSGIRCARATFYKEKSNYFKYYMMLIASLLGRLTLFTTPIFDMAQVELAKVTTKYRTVSIRKTFEGVDNPKLYWSFIVVKIILGLLLLGGTLMLVIIAGLFGMIGLAMLWNVNQQYAMYLAIGLMVPPAICLIVFYILFAFTFAPTNFVLKNNPNFTVSQVLHACVDSMKKTGKLTLFWIYVIYGLFDILYLGVAAGICYFLYIQRASEWFQVAAVILAVFFTFIYLNLLPKLHLGLETAKYRLFEDIISFEDKPVELKVKPIVNLKKKRKQHRIMLEGKNKEEILVSLFKEEITPIILKPADKAEYEPDPDEDSGEVQEENEE